MFPLSPPLGRGLRKRKFPEHQTAKILLLSLMIRARKVSELNPI